MRNQDGHLVQRWDAVLSHALLISLLFLLPNFAEAFSLLGPDTPADGQTPPEAHVQLFTEEFRWSISTITYSIDDSFSTTFGEPGVTALRNAFATWDPAFGEISAPTSTEIFTVSPFYDLESVALHEIGHALGLSHPDKGQLYGRNYDSSGSSIPATGSEVMTSSIEPGEIARGLTSDDLAGLNYLYDPTNVNVVGGPGVGDVDFAEAAATAALEGTGGGANIDIFAVPGNSSIFAGATDILALSLTSFVFPTNTDGPGIINGVEQFTPIIGGVDIYFNASQQLGVLTNPAGLGGDPVPTPEPGTLILLVGGLAGLFALRRRTRYFH